MPKTTNTTFNVASCLPRMAEKMPSKLAVVFPSGVKAISTSHKRLTFYQLNEESSSYAWGLHKLGVREGERVLLMVKPGCEFMVLAFSLFRMGAIPILIDPGMGLLNLLKCIKQVGPGALIGGPLVHLVKALRGEYFSSIKNSIIIGRKFLWKGTPLNAIRHNGLRDFAPVKKKKDDPAAILFTSGSTGAPKGVLYQHGMFMKQVEQIKSHYGICETDVDLPAFPLFALFSVAIGMTCVIPDIDFAKPAKVNPKKIVKTILKHNITTSFGSPAIWSRVGEYCLKHRIRLPSLKRILMAGAPVPGHVLEKFSNILTSRADTFIPYGATEALPVTSMRGKERLKTEEKSRKGAGTCVGKPLPGMTVKIILITDVPIPVMGDNLLVGKGEKGEIIVKGDVVTREYFCMKEQTALAKISDGDTFWHRMGDIGYFDEEGLLWFCGRKDHRVVTKNKTLFPVPCEAVFNQHPGVYRSALVGVGPENNKRPIIIIEPEKRKMPSFLWCRKQFVNELLEMGRKFEHTKDISVVLFHPSFPVDIRHNVKISRGKLSLWAEGKLK